MESIGKFKGSWFLKIPAPATCYPHAIQHQKPPIHTQELMVALKSKYILTTVQWVCLRDTGFSKATQRILQLTSTPLHIPLPKNCKIIVHTLAVSLNSCLWISSFLTKLNYWLSCPILSRGSGSPWFYALFYLEMPRIEPRIFCLQSVHHTSELQPHVPSPILDKLNRVVQCFFKTHSLSWRTTFCSKTSWPSRTSWIFNTVTTAEDIKRILYSGVSVTVFCNILLYHLLLNKVSADLFIVLFLPKDVSNVSLCVPCLLLADQFLLFPWIQNFYTHQFLNLKKGDCDKDSLCWFLLY